MNGELPARWFTKQCLIFPAVRSDFLTRVLHPLSETLSSKAGLMRVYCVWIFLVLQEPETAWCTGYQEEAAGLARL